MKRCIAFICVLLMLCGSSACGGASWENDPRPLVVCTVFPAYDFVREVAGDLVNAVLLTNNGADMHSYSPSAGDIAAVKSADLFLYVGGASDKWATDVIEKGALALPLTAMVNDAHKDHDHAEEEHVWLSLRNAQTIVDHTVQALCRILPDKTTDLYAMGNAYKAKLASLDAAYGQIVSSAKRHAVVLADRYPFRHLFEDYGIVCYAAFDGCSSETQASFDTVAALSGYVTSLQLPAVLKLDDSDGSLADAVRRAAGKKDLPVLTLHAIQSVSKTQLDQGVTYLSLMSQNLTILQEALC